MNEIERARQATEPHEAEVARLGAVGPPVEVELARGITTPDEAAVLRVLARRAPVRTRSRAPWVIGLVLAGAAWAGAAWWRGEPEERPVETPEVRPVERVAVAPVGGLEGLAPPEDAAAKRPVPRAVEPPVSGLEKRVQARPKAVVPPPVDAPVAAAPIPAEEPVAPESPPVPAPPPETSGEARVFAGFLGREEAGEPARALLTEVEAWVPGVQSPTLRAEGELLALRLAARVRAPGVTAPRAIAWAEAHPAHPRVGEVWLLAGDLSERAHACAEARRAWTSAAEHVDLADAVAERRASTRCR